VETIDQSEEPLLRAREAMVAATLLVTARRSGWTCDVIYHWNRDI